MSSRRRLAAASLTVALAIALAAGLGGCAALAPDSALSVDRIVGETLSAARAPAEERKGALAAARAAYERSPGVLNRLRLAMLLSMLPPPLHDDARAAELLRPIADPSSPGAGRFAALLAAQIAERQRQAREMERANRDLEESVRSEQRAAREHEEAQHAAEAREEALRQQLDALRAIERGILEREDQLRRKPHAKP